MPWENLAPVVQMLPPGMQEFFQQAVPGSGSDIPIHRNPHGTARSSHLQSTSRVLPQRQNVHMLASFGFPSQAYAPTGGQLENEAPRFNLMLQQSLSMTSPSDASHNGQRTLPKQPLRPPEEDQWLQREQHLWWVRSREYRDRSQLPTHQDVQSITQDLLERQRQEQRPEGAYGQQQPQEHHQQLRGHQQHQGQRRGSSQQLCVGMGRAFNQQALFRQQESSETQPQDTQEAWGRPPQVPIASHENWDTSGLRDRETQDREQRTAQPIGVVRPQFPGVTTSISPSQYTTCTGFAPVLTASTVKVVNHPTKHDFARFDETDIEYVVGPPSRLKFSLEPGREAAEVLAADYSQIPDIQRQKYVDLAGRPNPTPELRGGTPAAASSPLPEPGEPKTSHPSGRTEIGNASHADKSKRKSKTKWNTSPDGEGVIPRSTALEILSNVNADSQAPEKVGPITQSSTGRRQSSRLKARETNCHKQEAALAAEGRRTLSRTETNHPENINDPPLPLDPVPIDMETSDEDSPPLRAMIFGNRNEETVDVNDEEEELYSRHGIFGDIGTPPDDELGLPQNIFRSFETTIDAASGQPQNLRALEDVFFTVERTRASSSSSSSMFHEAKTEQDPRVTVDPFFSSAWGGWEDGEVETAEMGSDILAQVPLETFFSDEYSAWVVREDELQNVAMREQDEETTFS
ncbi:hypothetical protein K402DRAFT_421966 [Aulographum hederae CBS 113979]|uniref:Uncharacterized protein n=1 Tax=Aulographum hederae CBS 113979 TaxID=1176131 RepID=A0A6G1GXN4_9PEZI|nr:hypothetical protein K402DRAFT_421966 [Aulographum hederae CBS 113979]